MPVFVQRWPVAADGPLDRACAGDSRSTHPQAPGCAAAADSTARYALRLRVAAVARRYGCSRVTPARGWPSLSRLRRVPEAAQRCPVDFNHDGRVALDVREHRLADAVLPLVAAIARVLTSLAVLDARKGAHQVVRVGVVARRAVADDVHLPPVQ